MAKTEVRSEAHSVLPVPTPVVEHHLKSLHSLLTEWAATRKLPPVLLLTGPSGVGKRSMAYFLSQWILCQNTLSARGAAPADSSSGEEEAGFDLFGGAAPASPSETGPVPLQPCGKCQNCQRALKGSWVDFTEIVPEEDGESLKIEQFRKLKETQGFGAHEGAYRIFLITNADRMTPQAANSMLKLLEEPPRGWIFLLTAGDPGLLLPTLISRCQVLRLKPFSSAELQELLGLSGIPTERRQICAELAQGSWGKALRVAEDGYWGQRKALFDFIRDPAACLNPLVDWASVQPAHFDFLTDQLEFLLSDLIQWSLGTPVVNVEAYPWRNLDGRTALCDHAKKVLHREGSAEHARRFWIARAERLARARSESAAPLNRKILLQDVLIPWVQVTG